MRDPVSQDVLIAAGKAVPPIAGTVVTATHGLPWTDLVAISTVVYTVVLTATTVMRNWGDWAAWIAARCAWARGLWGRLRGRA